MGTIMVMLAHEVIKDLAILITEADARRLLELRVGLIKDNEALGGHPYGFVFQGHHFVLPDVSLRGAKLKTPHSSLVQRAAAYITDEAMVQVETAQIRQILFLLLRSCETSQDIRDAIPESVAELHPILKSLPRTRPEAWTLKDRPVYLNQYKKLRDKIDFYVTARLLY